MKLQGERNIPAAPHDVWRLLLEPETLKTCIPGCESLEQTGEGAYAATVVIKVGPVKARFSGTVSLSDLVAPVSCRLNGQGNGGVAGFAKGEATISLRSGEAGSILSYDASIEIGGKIAALGDRLFRSVVDNNVTAFFDNVAKLTSDDAPRDSAGAAAVGAGGVETRR